MEPGGHIHGGPSFVRGPCRAMWALLMACVASSPRTEQRHPRRPGVGGGCLGCLLRSLSPQVGRKNTGQSPMSEQLSVVFGAAGSVGEAWWCWRQVWAQNRQPCRPGQVVLEFKGWSRGLPPEGCRCPPGGRDREASSFPQPQALGVDF